MDTNRLQELLQGLKDGAVEVDDALKQLRTLPYDDLENFARLDLHRDLRNGMPEVVFCEGKTTSQIIAIMDKLWQHHDRIMGSRVSPDVAADVQARLPDAAYDPTSRLLTLNRSPLVPSEDAPYAMVTCGGTSDLPVAEEAAQVLEFVGHPVERAYDVGVAGLHRLLGELDRLMDASVVIVVAGMEGALTSVVAGLVSAPVIGVPTSVGYGVNFDGVAPMLTMLNSCASGVTVVNIDNGYGAAVSAHLMLRQMALQRTREAESTSQS